MNTSQIELAIKELVTNLNKETFIFDLLLAYGLPQATITRLKKGQSNLSKEPGVVSLKNRVLFKPIENGDLHLSIAHAVSEVKANQRFLIVTDFNQLLAQDMSGRTLLLEIKFTELSKHFAYFLPWAGIEKVEHHNESPADRKAAEKLAKLYDDLKASNNIETGDDRHALNVFLTRLLFCLFAEDTGIFEDGLFTNSIGSYTQPDGSDMADYLGKVFRIMGQSPESREELPSHLASFPFVGESLFGEIVHVPTISRRGRAAILEAGELDWAEINPDIFGSMIQAVVADDDRGELGMHYTSVPNIMKVIGPLFLEELQAEYEGARGNEGKLRKLLHRIHNLHIFDPACGSGNFLIIAYKELRRLEMKILTEIKVLPISGVRLDHFHGIEIDDFASKAALLSIWLSEHQMNREFFHVMGQSVPALPLRESASVIRGNSCRLDWGELLPVQGETFIVGNPPYLGSSVMTDEQKSDAKLVCGSLMGWKNLDYIALWFVKSAQMVERAQGRVQAALVSTNSICQGEQVGILWPWMLERIQISFAHQAFKWTNFAKNNAGVTVVVIGLTSISDKRPKKVHSVLGQKAVELINPYLLPGPPVWIKKRSSPLASNLSAMMYGSKPVGTDLLLDDDDREEIIAKWSEANEFIKPFVGADELIKGKIRYCLWVADERTSQAMEIEPIKMRIQSVQSFRERSKKIQTQEAAGRPHQFGEPRHFGTDSIVVPRHSSERRDYLPIAFVSGDFVVSDSAQFVANATALDFSIISSKMHMAWLRTVGGRLETRYRYSSSLVYNTFPLRTLSSKSREELTASGLRILATRERYPSKTLAELYDPDKMPEDLLEAHRLNDEAVDRCYRPTPYRNDEERLQTLFNLYVQMIDDESNNGSLFQRSKEPRKKK